MRRVIVLMLRISLILGAVLGVASLTIPDLLMRIYADELPVIEAGVIYFRISAPAFLLTGVITPITVVLRSARQVRLPLIASIIAFGCNLFLNWVLIFGHLGLPEMQIAGAALATVISRVIEAGILLVYMLVVDKRIGLRVKHFFQRCAPMSATACRSSCPISCWAWATRRCPSSSATWANPSPPPTPWWRRQCGSPPSLIRASPMPAAS